MYYILIVVAVIIAAICAISIPIVLVNNKYKEFVKIHSISYRNLLEINKKYVFQHLENLDMTYIYDNANFYDDISTKDYLIYQLVYIQKDVKETIKQAGNNRVLFKKYKEEIKERCSPKTFDTDKILRNKEKLYKYENELLRKTVIRPGINVNINVKLYLTKINGRYITSKSTSFNEREINELIYKLNKKRGNFYLNQDIWDSICRVERGKVSNKMRFSIYKRDGYRCRICGSRENLEVDHIIPIAKGGKSTYDNLQTLCHYCNVKKGSKLHY